MINKTQFLALVFTAILSAGASATSLDGLYSGAAQSNQHGYLDGGMPSMPLGCEGGDPCCGQSGDGCIDGEYDVPIFVRGSFNDWGQANEMIFEDGLYHVAIDIEAGVHEFKIASEDWSTVDLSSEATLALDTLLLLGDIEGVNMVFDFQTTGMYLFTLDTLSEPDRSLANPLLTISLLQPMPTPTPGTLALIGMGLLVFVARRRKR